MLAECLCKPDSGCALAARKANCVLGCVKKGVASGEREVIVRPSLQFMPGKNTGNGGTMLKNSVLYLL